jgi:hypothetical protein
MTTEMRKRQQNGLATVNPIDDMFGGGGFQIPIDAPLPQIAILREKPLFGLPDGETEKSIVGHIIHWHHANQYYATEFGEGGQGPPTCASSDGMKPDGGNELQSDLCRNCPMNEYGSDKDGRGKACQNTIRLYFLADGEVIPSVIKANPSSLGKKESLVRWLTNAPNIAAKAGVGTKYQPIKVELKLHKKDFDSGFSASVLDISTVRVLDPKDTDDLAYLKKLAALYADFTQHYLGRIADDVASEKPHEAPADDADLGNNDEIPI